MVDLTTLEFTRLHVPFYCYHIDIYNDYLGPHFSLDILLRVYMIHTFPPSPSPPKTEKLMSLPLASAQMIRAAQDIVPAENTAKKDRSSSLVSRNVTIGTHRTSIRLEPDMWNGLREICRREHVTIHDIATVVAIRKPLNSSLTAAIRVFVMAYFRAAATEEGHSRAGHGPGGSFMDSLMHRRSEEQDNFAPPGGNGRSGRVWPR